MEIKQLIIENWKSIEKMELIEPNPFSVFVGPNASGKSNIFEALSYINFHNKFIIGEYEIDANETINVSENIKVHEINKFFGGIASFKPRQWKEPNYWNRFSIKIAPYTEAFNYRFEYPPDFQNFQNPIKVKAKQVLRQNVSSVLTKWQDQFFFNFSHLFINKNNFEKIALMDDERLSEAAGNLSKVLKRILLDDKKREEIVEWLQLLIPGFENIEIRSDELSGTDNLLIYEKETNKPFPGNLISDGTYNILALITAVFQSDEPQFLLIEEPENGLNPKVIKELVNLFRQKCEEEGHFVWLNTHSQTLVNQLKENEIILVDKKEGVTKVKQLKNGDSSGLPMDEAWLTNTLGGGIPW